ncbi:hypothetical protein BC830DRAFT_1130168 [Chytriomyces sp. MP71]|nr:hypothetical protein BC830DRAFT_1130168 [Chytriomyces sp. MP71]
MPEFKIELTLTHQTLCLVVRAVNILTLVVLDATAILHFVSGFDIFIGIYMMLLGCLLAYVDWVPEASWLVEYAGFLVTFAGRALICGLLGILTVVPPRNSYAAAPWFISFGLLFLVFGVFFGALSYAKRYGGDTFADVEFPLASDVKMKFDRFGHGSAAKADADMCDDTVVVGTEDGHAEKEEVE